MATVEIGIGNATNAGCEQHPKQAASFAFSTFVGRIKLDRLNLERFVALEDGDSR